MLQRVKQFATTGEARSWRPGENTAAGEAICYDRRRNLLPRAKARSWHPSEMLQPANRFATTGEVICYYGRRRGPGDLGKPRCYDNDRTLREPAPLLQAATASCEEVCVLVMRRRGEAKKASTVTFFLNPVRQADSMVAVFSSFRRMARRKHAGAASGASKFVAGRRQPVVPSRRCVACQVVFARRVNAAFLFL